MNIAERRESNEKILSLLLAGFVAASSLVLGDLNVQKASAVEAAQEQQWIGLIDEFVDNIRNNKTPLINLKWHKKTIEAMNAVYESILTGKVIKFK